MSPPRPRRQRREQERARRKNVLEVERLARQLPGAAPDRPIEVAAPGVAEIQARATSCPQCGGELELRGDRADSTPRGVLRELSVVCRLCHAPRSLWFRVRPAHTS
ncbi:MAG TPA: hypothetical protein VHL80_15205 [Polyangia bacterium]|nr:hypothetical protein [Polyangia bacterium]